MSKKTTYTVARCRDSHWENLMDAATLEGGNRDDVWAALENLEFFSDPWLVIKIKNGKVSATIFSDQKFVQNHAKRLERRLSANERAFCIRGQYKGQYDKPNSLIRG